MSNEQTTAPIFAVANVAMDINVGHENHIDNKNASTKMNHSKNQHGNALKLNVTNTDEEVKGVSREKKTVASTHANKKRNGLSAKTLNMIREHQNVLKRLEEEEEREKQREAECKRLEQEQELCAQQQKHEMLYGSRKQRKQSQVKPSMATQFSEGPVVFSTAIAIRESNKKRILYDDQRKQKQTTKPQKADAARAVEIENHNFVQKSRNSEDDWELQVEEISQCKKTDSSEQNKLLLQVDHNIIHQHEIVNQQNLNPQVTHNNDEKLYETILSHELCENHRPDQVLRAPVVCVLGHVDAGKTTLLDNLRQTSVQHNEVGGITQQIGATNVPLETIQRRTKICRNRISRNGEIILPGLLIIDTPGHDTFKVLRSRGSSLCDFAILVVDIMKGLELQTIESIRLLTDKQTPFVIALNKVDLLYDWKSNQKNPIDLLLHGQSQCTPDHFEKRCNDIICQFAKQHVNVALFNKNPDPNEFYSMVPTSARSGDGMNSLIAWIVETCQMKLFKRLTYTDKLQATVMEVKAIDGLGTTIDVVLVNGCLSVRDKIVIAGQEGPIVTQIRQLLIPKSNQELSATNQYENEETVQGTRVVKIYAKDLEKSLAGLPLFVARQPDEIEYYKNEIETILITTLNSIQLNEPGVYVQASTLGSLEGLVELLKASNIPCAGVNIGSIHKKDVLQALTQSKKDPLWATILAFDVKINKNAQNHAKTLGVKILQNDEIYRLVDMFLFYRKQMDKENRDKHRHLAVFPCKLKILPQHIFNSRDPIVCGVLVEEGFLKLGTSICVPSKNCIDLGQVVSIEENHESRDLARQGSEVCIKIVSRTNEAPKMYGRHFDKDDALVSKISRQSIDIVKAYFREDMTGKDWALIIKLKHLFNIA